MGGVVPEDWQGCGGRSAVGAAREGSKEQCLNQIRGGDRRPKAFVSEAVSFLVPSRFSARTGCGSRCCPPMVPGRLILLHGVVMSGGRAGVAAEL